MQAKRLAFGLKIYHRCAQQFFLNRNGFAAICHCLMVLANTNVQIAMVIKKHYRVGQTKLQAVKTNCRQVPTAGKSEARHIPALLMLWRSSGGYNRVCISGRFARCCHNNFTRAPIAGFFFQRAATPFIFSNVRKPPSPNIPASNCQRLSSKPGNASTG